MHIFLFKKQVALFLLTLGVGEGNLRKVARTESSIQLLVFPPVRS